MSSLVLKSPHTSFICVQEARNELGDLRAQFEALQLQRNTTENTRGNSAFSEVSSCTGTWSSVKLIC